GVDAEVAHARADQADPVVADVVLEVAVAPGEVEVDAGIAAAGRTEGGDEVVRPGEGDEGGRPLRVGGDHVQRLHADGVGHAVGDRGRAQADVGVDLGEGGDVALELAEAGVGAGERRLGGGGGGNGGVDHVEGRRGVAVDGEGDAGRGCERGGDVQVDL